MVVAGLVLLAACGGSRTFETSMPIITIPPTTSTTTGPLEVTPTGCSAPPITFALLCEVVELIDENHLSPPPHTSLAASAAGGVSIFTSTDPPDLPSRVTCAVPSVDFEILCDAIESRLRTDPVPLEPMVEAVVVQMLTESLDPYTQYVPPELAGALGDNGVIAGAGIVIGARTVAGSPCVKIGPACPLLVEVVIDGSPGDSSGLVVGDHIISVDGTDVTDLTVLDVAAKLSKPSGETTAVVVQRAGSETAVELAHEVEDLMPVVTRMVGNVGYLRLAEFGFETHLFVHFGLQALLDQGANRLILDLRDNPGGYLFSVSIIGSEFFADGLLYKTQSPSEHLDFPAVEGGIATRIPITVVVNENSASSAEILSAVLAERNRAVIVGQPTFGKNVVQNSFELHNGGLLRVTVSEWLTPGGATVAGQGVRPDIELVLPADLPVEQVIEQVLAATR
jgi:carboxyl-terminal processing protease